MKFLLDNWSCKNYASNEVSFSLWLQYHLKTKNGIFKSSLSIFLILR